MLTGKRVDLVIEMPGVPTRLLLSEGSEEAEPAGSDRKLCSLAAVLSEAHGLISLKRSSTNFLVQVTGRNLSLCCASWNVPADNLHRYVQSAGRTGTRSVTIHNQRATVCSWLLTAGR